MMKKSTVIQPRFFYDKNQKPVSVYLTIEDYTAFMQKLQKMAATVKRKMAIKKSKPVNKKRS